MRLQKDPWVRKQIKVIDMKVQGRGESDVKKSVFWDIEYYEGHRKKRWNTLEDRIREVNRKGGTERTVVVQSTDRKSRLTVNNLKRNN